MRATPIVHTLREMRVKHRSVRMNPHRACVEFMERTEGAVLNISDCASPGTERCGIQSRRINLAAGAVRAFVGSSDSLGRTLGVSRSERDAEE
jgi:hypothetical protein